MSGIVLNGRVLKKYSEPFEVKLEVAQNASAGQEGAAHAC